MTSPKEMGMKKRLVLKMTRIQKKKIREAFNIGKVGRKRFALLCDPNVSRCIFTIRYLTEDKFYRLDSFLIDLFKTTKSI